MTASPRTPGWRPGPVTAALIAINIVFTLWVFSPTWWSQLGEDSRDFYAAASLADAGGNPYNPRELKAEEDRLYNAPRGLRPGDPGYYAYNAYGYPPMFTRVAGLFLGAGPGALYGAMLLLSLGAGVGGFELLLHALRWRGRWLPRGFFVTSTPMVLATFVGNPSALLLLGVGAALLLLRAGRAPLAGVCLSLCLVKPAIGLPVAAVTLLFAPGRRAAAAAGFAAATLALLAINVVVSRPGEIGAWLNALTGYAGALDRSQPGGFSQQGTGLAGLPALLLAQLGTPVAVGLCGIAVALVVAALLRGTGGRLSRESFLPLGVALAAVVAVSPYLHLNDLVLEALPLLLVASAPLTWVTRVVLLVWFTGTPVRLLLTAIVAPLISYHPEAGLYGFGVVLVAAAVVGVAYRARDAARPSGPA